MAFKRSELDVHGHLCEWSVTVNMAAHFAVKFKGGRRLCAKLRLPARLAGATWRHKVPQVGPHFCPSEMKLLHQKFVFIDPLIMAEVTFDVCVDVVPKRLFTFTIIIIIIIKIIIIILTAHS